MLPQGEALLLTRCDHFDTARDLAVVPVRLPVKHWANHFGHADSMLVLVQQEIVAAWLKLK
jgi:hypothetical protein